MSVHLGENAKFYSDLAERGSSRRSSASASASASANYERNNSLEPSRSHHGVDNGVEEVLMEPDKTSDEFPIRSRTEGFDVEVVDTTDKLPVPRVTPDVNVYQQKKTLAQGMMDLALLSANANQLRYVLETGKKHPYYLVNLVLISISLILQVAVGVGLILNSRYNVKKHEDMCKANSFNNFTVVGIFVVTTVNVFISAFGIGVLEVEP